MSRVLLVEDSLDVAAVQKLDFTGRAGGVGLGAVGRLGRRLAEMREREAQDSKCTALVIHHKSEISDWLEAQGETRIDGKRTKEEQERHDRYVKEREDDEKLKRDDIEAYYAKYPYMRPDPEQEETYRKREARNAARRTGRSYRVRYASAKELEQQEQADKAHESGRQAAGRINLEPFVTEGQIMNERRKLKGGKS